MTLTTLFSKSTSGAHSNSRSGGGSAGRAIVSAEEKHGTVGFFGFGYKSCSINIVVQGVQKVSDPPPLYSMCSVPNRKRILNLSVRKTRSIQVAGIV